MKKVLKKSKFVKIDCTLLFNFMRDVFRGLGVPLKDAKTCAEVLIEADKMGFDTHGIERLKTIYYNRIRKKIQKPVTKVKILKQTSGTAVLDGGNGMGMVVSKKAMQIAIKKAKKTGIAMTVVKNSTHYGIAGYYALMAVREGMIGITGTNTRPSVAPTFGVEPLLGTNPLTFAIPTDEKFPFLLDCATSIVQRGKIEMYERIGKKVPEGWVIDEKGKFENDPSKILKGILAGKMTFLPIGGVGEKYGGYKGYGYSAVVEILSSAFCGGPFLKLIAPPGKPKRTPYRLGHFFIAINVSAFTDLRKFKKHTGKILRMIRNSKRMKKNQKIFTHGEKEYLKRKEREKYGIPVPEKTLKEIIQMRDELNLPYKFDFEKIL